MKRYLFVLLLAGCATPQERAQAYRTALENRCSAYGFTAGTPDFARCMMQLDAAARQQNDALLIQSIGNLSQPAPIRGERGSTTTHCTPDGLGGMRCRTN